MKVLVRDVRTKLFLQKGNSWTQEKANAHDFQSTCGAIDATGLVRELNEELEVVLSFGEEMYDVIIPISSVERHYFGPDPERGQRNRRSLERLPSRVKKHKNLQGILVATWQAASGLI
jgi:hypothetical protein